MFCPALSRQSGATRLAVYFYARLLRVGRNRVAPEVCADAEVVVLLSKWNVTALSESSVLQVC